MTKQLDGAEARRSSEISVTAESGDPIFIQREPRTRPDNRAEDVSKLKKSLLDNPRVTLDRAAVEVVAGLFADPVRIHRVVKPDNGVDGLAQVKSAQSDLYLIEGDIDFARLVPLVNPRLGHLPDNLFRSMTGAVDEHSNPLARGEMRFANVDEAVRLIGDTVWATFKHKGTDYSESILTHEIMTPIEVVLVQVVFDDGTPPAIVAVPYDGGSRTVSAAMVALGPPPSNPADFRNKLKASFTRRLLVKPAAALKTYRAAVTSYNAALARGLDMDVLRKGRSLTVPARIIVGGEFLAEGATHEALPSAIATLQAARHININPWDNPAQDAMAVHRMITSLALHHHISPAMVRLASNTATISDLRDLYGADAAGAGDDTGTIDPLWRAVFLVHALTRETTFEAGKRFIRSDLGLRQVNRDRYAGFLGVLLDQPWRSSKDATLTAARHAWRNFGALASDVWNHWRPVITTPDRLAQRALDGDENARITLLVAAGTALIADGVLTRDTGSKVDDGRTDYRSTPNQLLGTLLAPSNTHGIRQAATVLAHFKSDAQGGDGNNDRETYTYPAVGPDGALIASGTVHKSLQEGDLFRQADRARATQGEQDRQKRKADRARLRGQQHLTPDERNEQRRGTVVNLLHQAHGVTDELRAEIKRFPRSLRQHPFGTHDEWEKLTDLSKNVDRDVNRSEPPETEPADMNNDCRCECGCPADCDGSCCDGADTAPPH